MNIHDIDFVDLTNSFTLVDHCALANVIIDLDTDDSIIEDNVVPGNSPSLHLEPANLTQPLRDRINNNEWIASKSNIPKKKNCLKENKLSVRKSIDPAESKFGCCPICWDELGKHPLVSTKCGHVFCLKCLERSLSLEKRCPTCRNTLKGKSAYHPLYLPL